MRTMRGMIVAALAAAWAVLCAGGCDLFGTEDGFVPVREVLVSDSFSSITAGTKVTLEGKVYPDNATYKRIIWSLMDGGGTGAAFDEFDSTLTATSEGKIIVAASVAKGLSATEKFVQYFAITVTSPFVPVTHISGIPVSIPAGVTLLLNGEISPTDATNQQIEWLVRYGSGTGAVVTDGNMLTTFAAGEVALSALIKNGATPETAYYQEYVVRVSDDVSGFVPVANIAGVPTGIQKGAVLTLKGQVVPSNATNQTIEWWVVDPGLTGAEIHGNELTATNTGTVIIQALVTHGKGAEEDFTKDFSITVGDLIIPVKDITGIPTRIEAGQPMNLNALRVITPTYATNQNVDWSVVPEKTTAEAVINNGVLFAADSGGKVRVKGVIADGVDMGVDFVKDTFDILVVTQNAFIAVTELRGAPANKMTAGESLPLGGVTVLPDNATNRYIVWTVQPASEGTTVENAVIINNSELYVPGPLDKTGTVILKACVENGKAIGEDAFTTFNITVAPESDDFTPVTDITGIPASMTLAEPLTLEGTVVPDNATRKTITWTLVDQGGTGAVLGEDENGIRRVLTATAEGSVKVSAKIAAGGANKEDFTKDFIIAAKRIQVMGVTLDKTMISSLPLGTHEILTATVYPANAANKTVRWETGNADIVTVASGVLTPKSLGIAEVSVVTEDGGYRETCVITVTPIDVERSTSSPGVSYDSEGIFVINTTGEYTFTGVTERNRIAVAADVNPVVITLESVSINVSAISEAAALGIDGGNTGVTLSLSGENYLTSGAGKAGIDVPSGASIRIEGGGSLNAIGGKYGAGIGGGRGEACGNITIASGVINALAGSGAGKIIPGNINWGTYRDYETIWRSYSAPDWTLYGRGYSTVPLGEKPASDLGGAGIGGGGDIYTNVPSSSGSFASPRGTPGLILITGGTVNAAGALGSPGIGSGWDQSGSVRISGVNAVVRAAGSAMASGIGGGFLGSGVNIAIDAGSVICVGGENGAGLGGGYYGSAGEINIRGGSVRALGSDGAAGVGSGTLGSAGNISVYAGSLYAYTNAKDYSNDVVYENYSVSIGGVGHRFSAALAETPSAASVTISGGTVVAAGAGRAGIGYMANVSIVGGTVIAADCRSVTGIEASTVDAGGQVIDGVVFLSGVPMVFAPSVLGWVGDPALGRLIGDDAVTIDTSGNVKVLVAASVPAGAVLTVPDGITIDMGENLLVKNGSVELVGAGRLIR